VSGDHRERVVPTDRDVAVGRRLVSHGLGEPPLLLQPVVAVLREFGHGVRRKEVPPDSPLRQFERDRLGPVLAEFERTRVLGIGPRAARAVEAVGLVHRQQRLRSLEHDALLAQRDRHCAKRAPTAGGTVIRLKDSACLGFDDARTVVVGWLYRVRHRTISRS
jgi:hypothetical protein